MMRRDLDDANSERISSREQKAQNIEENVRGVNERAEAVAGRDNGMQCAEASGGFAGDEKR